MRYRRGDSMAPLEASLAMTFSASMTRSEECRSSCRRTWSSDKRVVLMHR